MEIEKWILLLFATLLTRVRDVRGLATTFSTTRTHISSYFSSHTISLNPKPARCGRAVLYSKASAQTIKIESQSVASKYCKELSKRRVLVQCGVAAPHAWWKDVLVGQSCSLPRKPFERLLPRHHLFASDSPRPLSDSSLEHVVVHVRQLLWHPVLY